MDWGREEIMHFIQIYRKKALLWDPQHGNHYNKVKKHEAWAEIAEELGKPVEHCRKKMESLLASLRREKMKMNRSNSSGKGPQDGYKSQWYALPYLQFIWDKNQIKSNRQYDEDVNLQEDVELPAEDEESTEASKISDVNEESCSVAEAVSSKRPKSTLSKRGKHSKEVYSSDRLPQLPRSPVNQFISGRDECYYFGNFVACKLRLYDEWTRCNIQNDILNIFQQANQGLYNINAPQTASTSAEMRCPQNSHTYELQNPSPSTSLQLSSPQHSKYSDDLDIKDLI